MSKAREVFLPHINVRQPSAGMGYGAIIRVPDAILSLRMWLVLHDPKWQLLLVSSHTPSGHPGGARGREEAHCVLPSTLYGSINTVSSLLFSFFFH